MASITKLSKLSKAQIWGAEPESYKIFDKLNEVVDKVNEVVDKVNAAHS